MTGSLTERYDDRIAGVLSCYDRVVVTGTLPTVCYAAGMTKFLYAIGVRIFDYPQFASTLRDRVRERAASLAAQAGITIEDSGKCLHYYFYFIDAELGLVYLRVPTWAPFRLQFYCNGHSWLARRLTAEGIGFTAADNAFIRIDDWQRAQDLADRLSPDRLHLVLDRYAAQCCPVLDVFRQSYHWSLMQVEYATDLVFRSVGTLRPLYQHLARESVLSVKADRQLSRPSDQPATGPGDRFSVFHSHRGDLHQTPLRQFLDQDVRQVRLRAPHRDDNQRRLLLQAPPQGGTSAGAADAGPRPRQEDHLQPD